MISCISKSWCSVKAFSETAKEVAFGVHCRMICAMARGSFRGKGRRLVAWWIQGVKGRKKFENIHFVLNFCIKLCFSVYGFAKTWYLDPSFLGGGCKKKHLRFGSQWLESGQQEEEIQGAVNHLSYENLKAYFEPKIWNHSTLKHSSVNQDQLQLHHESWVQNWWNCFRKPMFLFWSSKWQFRYVIWCFTTGSVSMGKSISRVAKGNCLAHKAFQRRRSPAWDAGWNVGRFAGNPSNETNESVGFFRYVDMSIWTSYLEMVTVLATFSSAAPSLDG